MSGADTSCDSCAALQEQIDEYRSQVEDVMGFNNHLMREMMDLRKELRARDKLISRLTLEAADKTLERLNDA